MIYVTYLMQTHNIHSLRSISSNNEYRVAYNTNSAHDEFQWDVKYVSHVHSVPLTLDMPWSFSNANRDVHSQSVSGYVDVKTFLLTNLNIILK